MGGLEWKVDWKWEFAAFSDDSQAVVFKIAEAISSALDEFHFAMEPSVMPLLRVVRHMRTMG